jgi:hypothetical protein
MKIPFTKIKQNVLLPDGSSLILYSTDDIYKRISRSEYARNFYRIAASGNVIWRVAQTIEDHPQCFEEFYWNEAGKLIAYNFDCWEYEVDLETGAVRPYDFHK